MSTFFEVANLLCSIVKPTSEVLLQVKKEERDLSGCVPEDVSAGLLEWATASIEDLQHQVAQVEVTEEERRWLRDRGLSLHDVIQDAMDRHALMRHSLFETIDAQFSSKRNET
jgi:hypothetical protein